MTGNQDVQPWSGFFWNMCTYVGVIARSMLFGQTAPKPFWRSPLGCVACGRCSGVPIHSFWLHATIPHSRSTGTPSSRRTSWQRDFIGEHTGGLAIQSCLQWNTSTTCLPACCSHRWKVQPKDWVEGRTMPLEAGQTPAEPLQQLFHAPLRVSESMRMPAAQSASGCGADVKSRGAGTRHETPDQPKERL